MECLFLVDRDSSRSVGQPAESLRRRACVTRTSHWGSRSGDVLLVEGEAHLSFEAFLEACLFHVENESGGLLER